VFRTPKAIHGIKSIGDLRKFLQFLGYYLKYPSYIMHDSYDR